MIITKGNNLEFDWEMLIIARNETEKAQMQCIRSFNNFSNREKKEFWWNGVLKKASELDELNKMILELEADADASSKPPILTRLQ